MARLLGVSLSGYYQWCQRQPSRRSQQKQALQQAIARVYARFDGSAGSPFFLGRATAQKCHKTGSPAIFQDQTADGFASVGQGKRLFKHRLFAIPTQRSRIPQRIEGGSSWFGDTDNAGDGFPM